MWARAAPGYGTSHKAELQPLELSPGASEMEGKGKVVWTLASRRHKGEGGRQQNKDFGGSGLKRNRTALGDSRVSIGFY